MKRGFTAALVLFISIIADASGADFSGMYTMNQAGANLLLTIQQNPQNAVSGTLSGNGVQFHLKGAITDNVATGYVTGNDAKVYFEAALQGNNLILVLIDLGPNGAPNERTAKQLFFVRQSGIAASLPVSPAGAGASEADIAGIDDSMQAKKRAEAPAVNHGGTYTVTGTAPKITLVINQNPDGSFIGVFTSSTGQRLNASGHIAGDALSGSCSDGRIFIFIRGAFAGGQLNLTIIQPDANNQPDFSRTGQAILTLSGAAPKSTQYSPGQYSPTPYNPTPYHPTPVQEPPPPSGTSALPKFGDISDSLWGFSFRAPPGWQVVELNADGALLTSATTQGAIIVLPHQYNLQQTRAKMQHGLRARTIQLAPQGAVTGFAANGFAGNYTGFYNGKPVKARAVAVCLQNLAGAFVVGVADPLQFTPQLSAAVESLARSVRQTKIGAGGELIPYFSGAWNKVVVNGVRTVTLYPDGTFFDYSESSLSGQYGDQSGGNTGYWSTGGHSQDTGRWAVRGTKQSGVIVLIYSNGEQAQIRYEVHVQNGMALWNEYKFDGALWRRSQ